MNKKEALAQYERTEKELQRLKAIIEAPERGRFKPENGDIYHHYTGAGRIYANRWADDETDSSFLKMGNCYRTREEAERARDKQLALVKLQDLADELNDGIPDWSKTNVKFSIVYNHKESEHVQINTIGYHQEQGVTYFTSHNAANEAIKRLTQEEISLIFDLNN